MGVNAKKLVYDFRRKFNSFNSGKNRDIDLVDIIAYLNEAQEIWFENRVFVAQTNQKVRNDLRTFIMPMVDLEVVEKYDDAVLAKYPDDLYLRLNQAANVSKSDCCDTITKRIIPRILQSDDLYEARSNPFRKADFFFEQLNAIEDSEGIIIYHDNEMDVDGVLIDYYRKPQEIHAPSLEVCDGPKYYDYCGNIITEDQDFEVSDTYSANMVVDIAILKASRDTNDIQGFQTQLNLIFQTPNLN